MIKRILIILAILLVIALLGAWLIGGDGSALGRIVHTITNPIDVIFNGSPSSGISIRLPWQPKELTQGPDISLNSNAEIPSAGGGNTSANIRTFGDPSPYAGKVHLADGSPTESSASLEYIRIEADGSNTQPITMNGWSLQSAVSGLRAYLPLAASPFIMGVVNAVAPVSLEPGATAIVTTAASPAGASFQENMCTGFLGQLQGFSPDLTNACPPPTALLPQTAETLRTYGATCIDFVQNLPQCYFPGANLPADITPACRSFLTNTFTYNGCLNTYRGRASFALSSWRLFLGMRAELWYNTHDVIRLLDANDRTVDVLSY
jgi:hypothetical protein